MASDLWVDGAIGAVCRSFLDVYGKRVHGLKPPGHVQYMEAKIQEVIEGGGPAQRRCLVIIAPPGHAKSQTVSQTLPSWFLGKWPTKSLLFFTSSDTMAHEFGNVVRLTLENPRHREIFSAKACQPDVKRGWSSDGLYLQGVPKYVKDPSYRALGYGASVIGARADGIILDDPLTQESSVGELTQKKAKSYFDMTIRSRLKPGGWIIAIMTRWHELDLGSHLVAQDDFEVLHLPALAIEPDPLGRRSGEALWPEMYPRAWLEQLRKEPPAGVGLAQFNAAYQGDPMGLGGDVFRAEDFQGLPADYRDRPPQARAVQYWDLAFSGREAADFTAGLHGRLDGENRLFVTEGVHARMSTYQTEDAMVDFAERHRPSLIGVEQSKFHQIITQQIIANVRRRVHVPVVAVPAERDKMVNAQDAAYRGRGGLLFVDKHASWWPALQQQAMGFPNAAHDDLVDALSGLCRMFALGRTRPAPRAFRYAPRPRHYLVRG